MVDQRPEPIAIVGSGCRFPGGSNSPSSLWKLLEKPRDVLKEISNDRLDLTGYYHPDGAHHGTTNVRNAYMLEEDIRLFDAQFFNIKPTEAESIDPQQRLLMEAVYESMEAAGLTLEGLRGSDTGVWVGDMAVDYLDILTRDLNSMPTYYATGTSRSILANRISYFFDWHGPSLAIDTACSSSMVAIHYGVQALRSGESRVALAAGTQLCLGPETYIGESKMSLLSATGRSQMWDENANGYARGEGVAAIVMKKLSDALKDGDHIECIIRNTGVNQDGRTNGLTVPSTEAQAALIKRTYANAGLDTSNPCDRPQYFEAHGTGTKAGDPREAQAIQEAFFSSGKNHEILHVGSIKTVIGHTEGTAGMAGIFKGSLALQNRTIPPNLLFNRLNPAIEPYYDNLKVPTEATPWPVLPEGTPRRVSINSFGFGGTNAHAILESYQPAEDLDGTPDPATLTPFVFSAVSERSLIAQLQSYSEFLKTQDSINLRNLAWTLQSRRSALPIKTSFSASGLESLFTKIDEKLALVQKDVGSHIGIRSTSARPRVLGVFTGQGAQWPRMGAALFDTSAFVRERFQHLEESLASLPEHERPQWALGEELLANAKSSRIAEAAMSQPLCTAVQVVLVDVMKGASIDFEAVVGHSSGEIAAAYAAGFISASDAIRIAYFRGLHAKLAMGKEGQEGSMLAVGTSFEDATELCELPVFEGRLSVAANNSSASVTMSGDIDAVTRAKKVFDEEHKFARLLKVDTAYHSHHMLACNDAYVASLRACKIQINQDRDRSCTWYSSVVPGKVMEPYEALQDLYWRDNMVNAVMFKEAITEAAKAEVNIAVEVGPHPALKGPASQNISEVRESGLPYTGILSRNVNDVEAMSEGFGFIWAQLGGLAVDFDALDRLVFTEAPRKLLKGLPSYQWDHGRTYWYESRISKNIRLKPEPFHQLLGIKSPDCTDLELHWRNMLKSSEIPWLDGHQLQGQTVFPAAGYVAMALEASKHLAKDREVKLFEVHDLNIGRAITFEDDANFAIETLVSLTSVTPNKQDDGTREAFFACYSCPNTGSGEMELASSGRVKVIFGAPSSNTMPSMRSENFNMSEVDADRFYSTLLDLGYGYNGPFRTMTSLQRKLDQASAMISTYVYEDHRDVMIVHPTMLDVSFQVALLAQSAPGDQRLWSLHVPTSIRCIRVNPRLCETLPYSGTKLPIDATLHPQPLAICADVDIYTEEGESLIQIEGVTVVPFSPATVADDRPVFSYTKFEVATPNGAAAMTNEHSPRDDLELAGVCERVAYYYLRKWKAELSDDEWQDGEWHHKCLLNCTNHHLSTIDKGKHPYVRKEWANDTIEFVQESLRRFPNSIDLKMLRAVGENIPATVRGETTILEHMMKDNMLDDIYKHGLGFSKFNDFLASMTSQIAHRYPHMNILEIGAGTGGATKAVLNVLGDNYSSYTYTDISSGFFEKASELFKNHRSKMTFKTFNAENTPDSQGYNKGIYDVVIASNVLHATQTLQKTLENTRRLIKPGGYLLLLEITNNAPIRIGTIFGSLSGWWVGVDDGRRYQPTISPNSWNSVLRKAGFSGVEAVTPDRDTLAWPFSIIAAQAVDDRVNFLRRPLSSPLPLPKLEELVIVGNQTLETSQVAEDVTSTMGKFCGKITLLDTIESEIDFVAPMSTFLILADLDDPIFKGLTSEKMEGLKRFLQLARDALWITQGCSEDEPYHMSSMGFGRAVSHEVPHLRLQFLDFDRLHDNAASVISETLLRLHATEEWEREGDLHNQMLWTREPELSLRNGKLMIPRVLNETDQNARINAWRRPVAQTVGVHDSGVTTIQATDEQAPTLQNIATPYPGPDHADAKIFEVHQSILSALKIGSESFLYLAAGISRQTGETIMSLSETNSSFVTPVALCTSGDIPEDGASALLLGVAVELLAKYLVSEVAADSSLLIHEPDETLASALLRHADAKGVEISFSTTNTKEYRSQWITLHPWASDRLIKEQIPKSLTHFIDLSINKDAKTTASHLLNSLPRTCKRLDSSTLFQTESTTPGIDTEALQSLLASAMAQAKIVGSSVPCSTIPLDHLNNSDASTSPLTAVNWVATKAVSVQAHPVEAGGLFSKTKSYLLVGLTGQIGQSVCEWMARNGAGYICLTSRRPNVDSKWIDSIEATGTRVKVFAMDITDKHDLRRVYDEIKEALPPVAGVMNAAMVLQDGLFADMSLEAMEKVFKPKVDGSNYLDELFYDTELDFFLLFSTLSSVVGNAGQANYNAASAYLTSLARQRRKRGLAASAVDIGRVAGIGYVERAGQVVQDQLTKYGYMPLSEADLHQMLAETIRAGKPESVSDAVVITGIRAMRDDEDVKVPWSDNPRFSHSIIEAKDKEAETDGKKTTLPVTEQLVNAKTQEQALEILEESFATKLQVTLQLPAEDIHHSVPLVELGVDSLVAVEVRSWFLKELKTDIPVLKVLSGGSVATLCQQTLEKMPKTLTPNMGTEGPSPAVATVPKNQAAPAVTSKSTESPTEKPSTESPNKASSGSSSPDLPTSHPNTLSSRTSSSNGSTPERFPSTPLVSSTPLGGVDTPNSTISIQPDLKKLTTFEPAIVRTERLSFTQSRFWFLNLLLEDQSTSNVAFNYHVNGTLRISDLERAVQTVGHRHEALRTCFRANTQDGDLAHQAIMDRSHLQLEQRRVGNAEEVMAEFEALKAHEFDIGNGKAMRVVILSESSTSHYLLICYHHIIMDGVSFQVFLKDLEKAYKNQPLGPQPCQFPEFSKRQHEAFEAGEMSEELQYWQGVFPDSPPVLPLLPIAKMSSRVPMKSYGFNQVECRLEPELAARIKKMATAQRSTTFHFYLTVLKTMLFRFLKDTDDLTIGIADANRNDSDIIGTIGLFLNLLALRFKYDPKQRFGDSLVEARNKAYAALGNSRLPFDVLLKELNIPRSSSYSPVFQAFFDYRQGAQEKQPFANCELQYKDVHLGRTGYDVVLDVTDSSAGTLVMFRTQPGMYDQAGASLLLDTYKNLLDIFSKNGSLALQDASLYSEKQIKHALALGKGPDMTSDWPETLPHRIDQMSQERPDCLAVKDGFGNNLTYAQMKNRIEAVAKTLLNNNVSSGSRVAVLQQATSDWICSLLAIMRIGAIYAPLDLRNPLPRLAALMASCQPTAILSDDDTISRSSELNVPDAKIVNVSSIPMELSTSVPNNARPDAVAAILYTSGSTGTPKGIMIKHSGLRNEMEGYTKTWKLEHETTLQQSAFTFDFSSDQIFTGLTTGGTVVVVPMSKRGDPLAITKLITEENITYTKATPSEYLQWLQYGSSNLKQATNWKAAFAGGEPLLRKVTEEFAQLNLPQLQLRNSYGPAEITISSTKMEIPYRQDLSHEHIPCGFQLPNYTAYILDDQLKPVAAGIPGEIFICGAGVSHGYLHNKGLTEKQYIPNPYASSEYTTKGWTKMYRTGDIGRFRPDGALLFENRVDGDTQVKIRGLRIELGDIESNMVRASNGNLSEAVVSVRGTDSQFLVAHVVFAQQHDVINKEEFLTDLLTRLSVPQYMIPVLAIPLDHLPLSNHSKVDRKAIKALPLPQRDPEADTTAGMTEKMALLKELWEDVLSTRELGFQIKAETSFFQVGGNSLLVVRLQSRIREAFNTVIPLADLLNAQTLGRMMGLIEQGLAVDTIDWDVETALPELGKLQSGRPVNRGFGKIVLVTGSTGYLSKYLLPRLVADKGVAKIHCIALRKDHRPLPVSSSKIITYNGNLTDSLFGLSEEHFEQLASQVDVMVHVGAARAFWDNYHLLRDVNVNATKTLVKLAAGRRIPIHFTSSAGVLPSNSETRFPASVAAYVPATDGSNGYVASKWASEMILEQASEKLGVPVTIHRFTPAETSSEQAKNQVLEDFITYADKLHLSPEMSGWKGRFDLIGTETAAAALSTAIEDANKDEGQQQQGKISFKHHAAEACMDVPEVRAFVEEKLGNRGYDKLQVLKWVGKAKASGMGWLFATQDITLEKSDAVGKTEALESKR